MSGPNEKCAQIIITEGEQGFDYNISEASYAYKHMKGKVNGHHLPAYSYNV